MFIIMMVSMLTMEFVPQIPVRGAKLLPSSLIAIIVAIIIEYVIVRNVQCGDVKCRTDVIGDVTPFSLTYPFPFFLDDQYDLSLITVGKAGQIIMQGVLLAIAGLVQCLMTVQVVTSYVKTEPHLPSVVWSTGLANVVSGFLGGMGGDAMIGLSTINCLNGGKGRLAPTVTATGVALGTMVAYPVLDFVPVSALAGVMIVVVLHTFKWGKIPLVLSALVPETWREPINSVTMKSNKLWMFHLPMRVDRIEALNILGVSLITIYFNLVWAVGVGLVITCLRFSWVSSQGVKVKGEAPKGNHKVYEVDGPMFFGSASTFPNNFDYVNDPEEVEVVFTSTYPLDYSSYVALEKVKAEYEKVGKKFDFKVDRIINDQGRTEELAPVAVQKI